MKFNSIAEIQAHAFTFSTEEQFAIQAFVQTAGRPLAEQAQALRCLAATQGHEYQADIADLTDEDLVSGYLDV